MIVAMLSGCSIFQRDADAEALSLKTKLSAAAKTFRKDSVMLSFTIINATNQTQRFCKWDTPFDPGIGKYMGISDAQGNEPPFIGAMARRVMPPPPESYIEVPANDSLTTVFNLADSYSLENSRYTIRFIGGGISGLNAGNDVKIRVRDSH